MYFSLFLVRLISMSIALICSSGLGLSIGSNSLMFIYSNQLCSDYKNCFVGYKMFHPSVGGILLTSPSNDVAGWVLLGVGMAIGWLIKVHPFFQYPCLGASLFCISRDYQVPLDVVLLAAIPICLIKWDAVAKHFLIVSSFIANYFWAQSINVPLHVWTPAVMAALYVGSTPHKLHAIALVLARHLVPRSVHVLYGFSLFYFKPIEFPFHDNIVATSVLFSFFAVMATEIWFHYVLVAIGLLSMFVMYI
jgi:hypothetical protein